MQHVKGLDTLRALSVFCVIIAHFGVWFDASRTGGRFLKEVLLPDSRMAVYFFFVLSGFLITSILLDAKQRVADSGKWAVFKNFFIRRALRIYPAYYILLLALFLANYPDVRQNIIYFATFTSNLLIYRTSEWNAFCITWTLSIEEQFYLLWPVIILCTHEKHLRWVFALAVVTGVVSTYITMALQHHIAPCLVYNCFDAFGIGGAYAWVRAGGSKVRHFERATRMLACVGIAIYFYWKLTLFNGHQPMCLFLEKTVDSIISVWLIILVLNNKTAWVKSSFLENKALNFIGKISFGIYLYHDVYLNGTYTRVNLFLDKLTHHHTSLNAAILTRHYNYWIHIAIMLIIATASFLLLEQPILKLKKIFTEKKPKFAGD